MWDSIIPRRSAAPCFGFSERPLYLLTKPGDCVPRLKAPLGKFVQSDLVNCTVNSLSLPQTEFG